MKKRLSILFILFLITGIILCIYISNSDIGKQMREKINSENTCNTITKIILKNKNRDKIIECLKKNEIGYAIHYQIPIHKQPLYLSYGLNFPKSEDFCTKILSLPSHSLLTNENVKVICEKINEVIG